MGTVALILCLIFFKGKPPSPPSLSATQTSSTEKDVVGNVGKVLRNGNAMILVILFGLVQGVGITAGTLLGLATDKVGFTDN